MLQQDQDSLVSYIVPLPHAIRLQIKAWIFSTYHIKGTIFTYDIQYGWRRFLRGVNRVGSPGLHHGASLLAICSSQSCGRAFNEKFNQPCTKYPRVMDETSSCWRLIIWGKSVAALYAQVYDFSPHSMTRIEWGPVRQGNKPGQIIFYIKMNATSFPPLQ